MHTQSTLYCFNFRLCIETHRAIRDVSETTRSTTSSEPLLTRHHEDHRLPPRTRGRVVRCHAQLERPSHLAQLGIVVVGQYVSPTNTLHPWTLLLLFFPLRVIVSRVLFEPYRQREERARGIRGAEGALALIRFHHCY